MVVERAAVEMVVEMVVEVMVEAEQVVVAKDWEESAQADLGLVVGVFWLVGTRAQ